MGQTHCSPNYPIYMEGDGRGYISTVGETLYSCHEGVASTRKRQECFNVFFFSTTHSLSNCYAVHATLQTKLFMLVKGTCWNELLFARSQSRQRGTQTPVVLHRRLFTYVFSSGVYLHRSVTPGNISTHTPQVNIHVLCMKKTISSLFKRRS